MKPSEEQLGRNWDELLQELRVTQTGIQILTGFLLTLPFTPRFAQLDHTQQMIYLATFVGSVATTGLIVAPVAFHRLLFRKRQRFWLVKTANLVAKAGLALLATTTSGVILLVFDVVVDRDVAAMVAGTVLIFLIVLWAGTPLLAHRSQIRTAAADASPEGRPHREA